MKNNEHNPFAKQQTTQITFGPMDLLNIRLGLEQIDHPSPKIKEAITQLDNIIHKFVMGFAPAQTFHSPETFPFPTKDTPSS